MENDCAELVFKGSIAEGDYNTPIKAVACVDGIWIDDAMLIPWEWIDRAREVASRGLTT